MNIIDGTGKDRYCADIAIKDGKIAKIGEILDTSIKEIDAKGKLVTPGWVDVHTHYMDKQLGSILTYQVGMV